jgi:hypothetical protein
MNLNKMNRSISLVNMNVNAKKIEESKVKSKISENKSLKLKSLIKEALYNSTAQAIIKISETPILTLKVFLLICVISSSGLCAYLINQLIMSYLSFGVSTTSRNLYETPALFPKITICNLNPFTTQYSMEFLRKVNKEVNPNIDMFNDEQMNKIDFENKYEFINLIHNTALYKMNELNETEKRKLSHPLEDIVKSCKINYLDCSANDFSWYFDSFYGNCWLFNSGLNSTGVSVPLVSNSLSGEGYGLQMSLYVNFYQNLTLINSSPSYGGGDSGALVRIENSSYLTSSLPEDGLKIPPGFKTSISVSRSFNSILPRPFSSCLIDNQTNAGFHSELFDLIHNSKYRYTQLTCFLQCLQRTTLFECNCTDPTFISLFQNTSQCTRKNEIDCVLNLWFNGDFQNKDFFQQNCFTECPLECYSDSFDFALSLSELMSKYYLDYLNSNYTNLTNDFQATQIDAETVKKSFVLLNVFYKSLSYELSTETPQLNLITLFANMGGYLGLFLGVSAFSLFEPVQILIEIIYMKYNE